MTHPFDIERDFELSLKPGDRIRMTIIVEVTLGAMSSVDPPRAAKLVGTDWDAWMDDQACIRVTDCKKL